VLFKLPWKTPLKQRWLAPALLVFVPPLYPEIPSGFMAICSLGFEFPSLSACRFPHESPTSILFLQLRFFFFCAVRLGLLPRTPPCPPRCFFFVSSLSSRTAFSPLPSTFPFFLFEAFPFCKPTSGGHNVLTILPFWRSSLLRIPTG